MKDKTMLAYTSPSIEVVSFEKEDVICTSPLLAATFHLGETSWQQTWLEKLQGLEELD